MNFSASYSPTPEILAIIDGFRRPNYSVAEMEMDGFTHVQAQCLNCHHIVEMPFLLLRKRSHVQDATTLAEIARAYRCRHCGGREMTEALPQPSYQYMGTSADTGNSPVNRRLKSSQWFLPKERT